MPKVRLIIVSLLTVFAVSAGVAASASAHNGHVWLENGVPITRALPVLSSGGLFQLSAGTLTIHCKKVTDFGLLLPEGLDIAHEIHFLECSTGATNCDVHSLIGGVASPQGLILVTGIETELISTTNSKGGSVLADLFKQKTVAGVKEFVTLGFTALAAEACKEYPETKVKGNVAAEVNGEELNFPKPELTATSLTAFGKAALFEGKDFQMFENGASLAAI